MNGRKKIYVMDDSQTHLMLVRSLFEDEGGYSVYTSNNQKNARQEILKKMPDVILLDLKMPKVNGIEMLKQFKSDPEISKIPVIVVTASEDASLKDKVIGLGACDFIKKPIGINHLYQKVHKIFE
jgi:CheY-like chemotaxis protein